MLLYHVYNISLPCYSREKWNWNNWDPWRRNKRKLRHFEDWTWTWGRWRQPQRRWDLTSEVLGNFASARSRRECSRDAWATKMPMFWARAAWTLDLSWKNGKIPVFIGERFPCPHFCNIFLGVEIVGVKKLQTWGNIQNQNTKNYFKETQAVPVRHQLMTGKVSTYM